MNNQFKNEFKNLNKDKIKEIVNRCARFNILETEFSTNLNINNLKTAYFIKYIEDENYGFWDVEWSWKKFPNFLSNGVGNFEYRIKISPFEILFENSNSSFNPYSNGNSKQQCKDYLQIYINKSCPHYKQAIVEEMEKFLKKIEFFEEEENSL